MESPLRIRPELVIHTGLDPTLMAELAAEATCNRSLLRRRLVTLHPGEALVPAVLRNDWKAWERRERLRRWLPWRQRHTLWVVAPGLVPPLLQERRFGRLQQQLSGMGLRMGLVVHLLDGREQLARDYARTLMALRTCSSAESYAQLQLDGHPQRYSPDRLFEPLLERCGARGLRFVRHGSAPGARLATTWATLERLGGAGGDDTSPAHAPAWRTAAAATPGPSVQQLQLAQELLGQLAQPPRNRQRAGLRRALEAQLKDKDPGAPPTDGWAEALGFPPLPPDVVASQHRLALKVWGNAWPETTSAHTLDPALRPSARELRRQARRRSRRRSG